MVKLLYCMHTSVKKNLQMHKRRLQDCRPTQHKASQLLTPSKQQLPFVQCLSLPVFFQLPFTMWSHVACTWKQIWTSLIKLLQCHNVTPYISLLVTHYQPVGRGLSSLKSGPHPGVTKAPASTVSFWYGRVIEGSLSSFFAQGLQNKYF